MRRIHGDEAGVALGLAIVIVVLIGVMGAGLLVPIVADLQATAEANRGQRAFAMAEAGISAAEARLARNPDLSEWSSGELRLEDVQEGSVVVTIERPDPDEARFAVVSTGSYGGARRRIEATFEASEGEPSLLTWRELYQ